MDKDFCRSVGIVLRAVPVGKVVTYGQVALLCGRPRNARQVGYTLRNDLCGQVPAHRVVNGRGFLSGAASFDYPGLQRQLYSPLLAYERRYGIPGGVDRKGEILLELGWRDDDIRALIERAELNNQ